MSVGINFQDYSGYLFYAIDSDGNELSIKLGNLFYFTREVIYSFNGKSITRKSGIQSTYSIYQFSTLLKFENNNLYHDYYDKVIIENAFKWDEKYKQHSLLKQYEIGKNKTRIYIGYNPSNINFNTAHSNYFVGCLDFFYINYEKINLQSNENKDVSSSCWNDLTHNICTNEDCQSYKVTENRLDCSFSAINVKKYCNKDLSNYENQTKSFERVGDKNQSTGIKFVWKLEDDKNYCLLKIILSDKSVLLFYINNKNLEVTYNQENNQTRTLMKNGEFKNLIHILIIKFDFPNIFIKASNGKIINSHIITYESKVMQVDIRFSSNFDKCISFKGETAFRYDFSEFRPILKPKSENSSNSKNIVSNSSILGENLIHLVFTTISVIMNILLIISVIILFIKRKENEKFPSVKSLNIYETVNFVNSSFPNQTRNDLRESAEYDYAR